MPFLFATGAAHADTGPKPSMEFVFNQSEGGQPLTITSGTLYECQRADCIDAVPLQNGGPQRFTCALQSCYALAYGFSTYHRLHVQFSDGNTRVSNIFTTASFDSRYSVSIRANDLLVEPQSPAFPRLKAILLICLCFLMIGGLAIGLMIFILRRCPKT